MSRRPPSLESRYGLLVQDRFGTPGPPPGYPPSPGSRGINRCCTAARKTQQPQQQQPPQQHQPTNQPMRVSRGDAHWLWVLAWLSRFHPKRSITIRYSSMHAPHPHRQNQGHGRSRERGEAPVPVQVWAGLANREGLVFEAGVGDTKVTCINMMARGMKFHGSDHGLIN